MRKIKANNLKKFITLTFLAMFVFVVFNYNTEAVDISGNGEPLDTGTASGGGNICTDGNVYNMVYGIRVTLLYYTDSYKYVMKKADFSSTIWEGTRKKSGISKIEDIFTLGNASSNGYYSLPSGFPNFMDFTSYRKNQDANQILFNYLEGSGHSNLKQMLRTMGFDCIDNSNSAECLNLINNGYIIVEPTVKFNNYYGTAYELTEDYTEDCNLKLLWGRLAGFAMPNNSNFFGKKFTNKIGAYSGNDYYSGAIRNQNSINGWMIYSMKDFLIQPPVENQTYSLQIQATSQDTNMVNYMIDATTNGSAKYRVTCGSTTATLTTSGSAYGLTNTLNGIPNGTTCTVKQLSAPTNYLVGTNVAIAKKNKTSGTVYGYTIEQLVRKLGKPMAELTTADKVNYVGGDTSYIRDAKNGFQVTITDNTLLQISNLNSKQMCEIDLANSGLGFYGSKTYAQKLALMNLFQNYPQYNQLLNFLNPSCSNSNPKPTPSQKGQYCSVNGMYSRGSRYEYDYFDPSNKNSFYSKDYANSSGVGHVRCYAKFSGLEPGTEYFVNKPTIKAGSMLWNASSSQQLIKSKITVGCVAIYDNDSNIASNINSAVNKTLNLNLKPEYNIKYDNGYYGLVTNQTGKTKSSDNTLCDNGVCERRWTVDYTYSTKYGMDNKWWYIKGGGAATKNCSSVVCTSDAYYGFPTSIDSATSQTIHGNINLNVGVNYAEKSNYFNNLSANCSYSIAPELTQEKEMNLKFRVIDTSEPFPGITGFGRKPGRNWSYLIAELDQNDPYNSIVYGECFNTYNPSYLSPLCVAVRNNIGSVDFNACEVKGDCGIYDDSSENSIVEEYITNRNDSSNSQNREPIFSIMLTAEDIKSIKEYNESHSYDDYNMRCTNGEECKSNFISRLFNGSVGGNSLSSIARTSLTEGSCYSTASGRDYCVGGDS